MSLPGRPSPSTEQTITQTQYSREAPDIEARRVQLMDTAADLAAKGKQPTAGDITIPTQGVAALTPMQQQAFTDVTKGIGTYQPFLNQATAQTLASTAAYDPSTAYQQYMNPYQSYVTKGIEDQFAKLHFQVKGQHMKDANGESDPFDPAEDKAITLPLSSVIETMVLLNVA